MNQDYLYSFLFYCLISSITPGPANLCSFAASLKFGRKAALKQWRGLFLGFFIISMLSVLICWLGGGLLGSYVRYLSYLGAAYLLWLACKMLRSSLNTDVSEADECSFKNGLLVNLTNAKIIIYCTTVLSIYVLPYSSSFTSLLAVGLFLPFTGPVCNLVWLFFGDFLRRFILQWQRQVNIVLALSLVLCAVSLLK